MASYKPDTNGIAPNITLYTNHGCPYAHRAHIALKELKLPYEEIIIDLDKPREPWYLEINPVRLQPHHHPQSPPLHQQAPLTHSLPSAASSLPLNTPTASSTQKSSPSPPSSAASSPTRTRRLYSQPRSRAPRHPCSAHASTSSATRTTARSRRTCTS